MAIELDDASVAGAFPEYVIQSGKLGNAGFKDVYRVNGPDGTCLALKIVREPIQSDETGEDSPDLLRFAREIEAMKSVSHPHIISIHDAPGQRQIGPTRHWWYTERFCEGGTLADRLAGQRGGDVLVRQLLEEMLDALDHLSSVHNMVHRDIKPDNIGIGARGEMILLDLGILVDLRLERITSTFSPSPLSLPWAAPEQITGIRADSIDTRTDLFQLGVVAFQTLTGMHPFYEGLTSVSDPIGLIEAFDPNVMNGYTSDAGLRSLIARCLRTSQNARPRNPRAALSILSGGPS